MSPPEFMSAEAFLSRKAEAIETLHPVDLGREILIPGGTLVSRARSHSSQKEMRTYELYSAFEGTTVDPEPNFVKAVVELGDIGELSPNCFRASSFRLMEGILTLLRLRIKPVEEAPTKSGRRSGRQAPTMPIEDSTMAQYTRGEFISAGAC